MMNWKYYLKDLMGWVWHIVLCAAALAVLSFAVGMGFGMALTLVRAGFKVFA